MTINTFTRKASQKRKTKRKAKHKINLGVKAKLDTIRKKKVIHIIIMGLNIIKKKNRRNITKKIFKVLTF